MFSQSESKRDAFSDFCGSHKPDFSTIDETQAKEFFATLKEHGLSKMRADLDQLPLYAAYGLSKGLITSDQVITLLEFRAMSLEFPQHSAVPILDLEQKEFTLEAKKILGNFLLAPEDYDNFLKKIQALPTSERYFFTVTDNENLEATAPLVQFATALKIMHVALNPMGFSQNIGETKAEKPQNSRTMTTLSAGARMALTELRFGQHAKRISPQLGDMSRDDIDRYLHQHSRGYATKFPGINTRGAFHGIKAKSFYLALHDELHRQLISSIPNPLYEALLNAIDLVRKKTDIRWSRDIWDCLDMEVNLFLDPSRAAHRDDSSEKTRTEDFAALLSAEVASENRLNGLFADSLWCEATWLLMIDLFQRPDFWKQKGINPDHLPEKTAYGKIYKFIVANQDKLDPKPAPAAQVVQMMRLYFEIIETPKEKEEKSHPQFVAKKEKEDYLQIYNGDQLAFHSKKALLIILQKKLNPGLINFSKEINNFTERGIARLAAMQKYVLLGIIPINQVEALSDQAFSAWRGGLIDNLIANKIISIDQLKNLSDKTISALKDSSIRNLIENKIISIDRLNNFSDEAISALKDSVLGLIENKIISIDQLNNSSDKTIAALKNYSIRNLIENKIISIDQLNNSSDKTISALKNYAILDLIRNKIISIDQLNNLSNKVISALRGTFGTFLKKELISIDQIESLPDKFLEKIMKLDYEPFKAILNGEIKLQNLINDYNNQQSLLSNVSLFSSTEEKQASEDNQPSPDTKQTRPGND